MYLQYIKNIIDISVVYYIVYNLILLIKGTRAMHVIWGIFILAIITSIAKLLNLSATMWMMQQFWLAGIFLLIVVFQVEIRSALANIGTNPLGRILMPQEYKFIKEMISALKAASNTGMGMIIVLEQDMGLKDIMDTGIMINGEVSKELLLTVFFNKTQLHDGAVIISNNRLIAAGCILPLTEQKELSMVFGMRHRAAIGLSEICDSIIIVVSEETGQIALARNGKLQQSVDIDKLENMLYTLYRSKSEKTLLRRQSRNS
ncbi:MAG: diadenylate cyclase CdaA [Elusimicrobia bacterium]|nr:diadenylate cyclase CdaA [Elusimicrobiota bacterium]